MKVFISWSGPTSHEVARVLRGWLPSVIQSLIPYVSSEDIDKGARWSSDIAEELSGASFGIACVTRDNMDAPWLNFEAGALSKSFDTSKVCPFLFHVKRSQLQDHPLLQFQSVTYTKQDVRKLTHSMNDTLDSGALSREMLDGSFDVWWPNLKKGLDGIRESKAEAQTKAQGKKEATSEILEEVLGLLRLQHRQLNSPESVLPPDYLERILVAKDARLADLSRHWGRVEYLLSRLLEKTPDTDDVPRDEVTSVLRRMRAAGRMMRGPDHPRRRRLWVEDRDRGYVVGARSERGGEESS